MMVRGNPLYPLKALLQAFSLMRAPEIKRYVWAPFCINILIFSAANYWILTELGSWLNAWLSDGSWLEYLRWLIMPLAFIGLLLTSSLLFNWIAVLIASPLCGLLAEKVAMKYCDKACDSSSRTITSEISHAFAREWLKFRYYLPRVLCLFLLSLIPVVNLLMPVLWALWGAWMMGVQYLDLPADNRHYDFQRFIKALKTKRIMVMVFGAVLMALMMIPIINFAMIPLAVIAATLIWERQWESETNV
jgi:CysZ protein